MIVWTECQTQLRMLHLKVGGIFSWALRAVIPGHGHDPRGQVWSGKTWCSEHLAHRVGPLFYVKLCFAVVLLEFTFPRNVDLTAYRTQSIGHLGQSRIGFFLFFMYNIVLNFNLKLRRGFSDARLVILLRYDAPILTRSLPVFGKRSHGSGRE